MFGKFSSIISLIIFSLHFFLSLFFLILIFNSWTLQINPLIFLTNCSHFLFVFCYVLHPFLLRFFFIFQVLFFLMFIILLVSKLFQFSVIWGLLNLHTSLSLLSHIFLWGLDYLLYKKPCWFNSLSFLAQPVVSASLGGKSGFTVFRLNAKVEVPIVWMPGSCSAKFNPTTCKLTWNS